MARTPKTQDDDAPEGASAFAREERARISAQRGKKSQAAAADTSSEDEGDDWDRDDDAVSPDDRRPPRTDVHHEAEMPSSLETAGRFYGDADDEFLETDWVPPHNLEAPPPRQGFVQRWVRFSVAEGVDNKNVQRRLREGWRPRDPSSVPRDYFPPTTELGDFGRCIGVEGLILCEMPASRNAQRNAFYRSQVERQTEAIDQDLLRAQGNSGIPIRKSAKTRVTTGRPPVQPDD